jgi:hypothetical protein
VSAPDVRCAQSTLAAGEALAGTAPYARAWIALEQPGPWGRGALEQSHLPAGLGAALVERAREAPVTVVLIRRPGRHADTGAPGARQVLVAHTGPTDAWLRAARLPDPWALLDLDFAALCAGAELALPGVAFEPTGPAALVCTNAQRDLCCAERGRPLALGLAAEGAAVWESSHLGGHRFAPTAAVLPYGVVLGRATADDVRAALSGRIPLQAYRGRSAYPAPAQAAEAHVRAAEGLASVHAVADVADAGGGRWRVTLADGGERAVRVTATVGPQRKESCRKPPLAATGWTAEAEPLAPR